MAKRKELTFQNFIRMEPDAEPVPLESLTEEQMQQVRERWRQRLSENMSRYYSLHPEEYAKL